MEIITENHNQSKHEVVGPFQSIHRQNTPAPETQGTSSKGTGRWWEPQDQRVCCESGSPCTVRGYTRKTSPHACPNMSWARTAAKWMGESPWSLNPTLRTTGNEGILRSQLSLPGRGTPTGYPTPNAQLWTYTQIASSRPKRFYLEIYMCMCIHTYIIHICVYTCTHTCL